MKIYTKKGDQGQTSLYGGKRLLKSNIRIESYGNVDELNSYIGLIAEYTINSPYKLFLRKVQETLFSLGARLAADPEKIDLKIPTISNQDVLDIENQIDQMESYLSPLKYFILPGGHKEVAFAHIARTVCRRAERTVVNLSATEEVDEINIKYLNRLSDYIFVLSRWMAKELNAEEIPWIPKL